MSMTNSDWLARRYAAVPRGVGSAAPIFAAHALNAVLTDVNGDDYIDFAGGIAVLNTGHRHPKVIEAVRAQLEHFTHTAFQVTGYGAYVELAERLNALAPIDGPAKTILFSTGAEAVENAVKIARAATGRTNIIAFGGGFHGRTALTMALTGKVSPYKKQFGAPAPGVYHAQFPAVSYGVNVTASLASIEHLFKADIDPSTVAAFILEPVQGEGGFHMAPATLMQALRQLCDQHGMLLIADEVQTGFGRTGKMFAMEHYDVRPDLMTMAKSLAGGLPLSAVVGRASIMDAVEPGGLGGTYAGSPLACAAALAVLDVMVEDSLADRAQKLGAVALEKARHWAERTDLAPIAHVRGVGSMVAFDLVRVRGAGEPDGAAAKVLATRALERRLLLLTCGAYGETVRMLYPLTISEDLLREGLMRLEEALRI